MTHTVRIHENYFDWTTPEKKAQLEKRLRDLEAHEATARNELEITSVGKQRAKKALKQLTVDLIARRDGARDNFRRCDDASWFAALDGLSTSLRFSTVWCRGALDKRGNFTQLWRKRILCSRVAS